MLDFTQFRFLSFDCYGTLIDWEAGILAALWPWLAKRGHCISDRLILEKYGTIEAEVEHEPYRPYRQVLEEVVLRMARQLGFEATDEECRVLPESLASWPAFPDSVAALAQLRSRFRLAVLSNVDDNLFAASAEKLGNPFEFVVTAQQVGSYKPSLQNFRVLLAKLAEQGITPNEVLHVAQSRFHDIAPAKALGLATVWVNRYGMQAGATPLANAEPDLEAPSLAALVEHIAALSTLPR